MTAAVRAAVEGGSRWVRILLAVLLIPLGLGFAALMLWTISTGETVLSLMSGTIALILGGIWLSEERAYRRLARAPHLRTTGPVFIVDEVTIKGVTNYNLQLVDRVLTVPEEVGALIPRYERQALTFDYVSVNQTHTIIFEIRDADGGVAYRHPRYKPDP